MSHHNNSALAQSPRPAFPRADGAGIIQQAVFFFLGCEAGEFRVEFVVG
jgi:hypothetical protein